MKISRKWRRMADMYKKFSLIHREPDAPLHIIEIWDKYDSYRDFSNEAMELAYRRESYGEDIPMRLPNGKINGYIEGKQWMDLTITEYWLPDLLSKELFAINLYSDFPKEVLDKILPERFRIPE